MPTPSAKNKLSFPSERLLTAVSNIKRWRILSVMLSGELIPIIDLSKRIGEKPSATSKHVAVLVRAGIAQEGAGGLYRLADRFMASIESGELDFGHFVLRIPKDRTA